MRGPNGISVKWELLHTPVVLATLLVGVLGYDAMPELVPMHMGFDGSVDSWAAKRFGLVLIIPGIQLFLAACFALAHWRLAGRGLAAGSPAKHAVERAQSCSLVVAGLVVNLGLVGFQLSIIGVVGMGVAVGIVLAVAILATAIAVALAARSAKASVRLAQEANDQGALEEMRHWKWGLFYVNPDDTRVFVPERQGTGWTLNMARPLAWLLIAALFVPCIVIVLVSVLMG